ncbi:protease modulator HflC [Shewanella sp. 1_MG-2023]|uniref:Protein HflC n=1 Tax=Shewanella electrodiphila TaxID=934143 RepID=A0ABT0KPU5_9GAMM|nr:MULTISPECIES: protease modulator HflC [Shewanella]MCC4834118.1 protease modulator HflC [Shewanella sp. 10N.7]MCL1045659.1 protease modulator HflC [Shewanella electrodiphila]MDO6611614.1 protease modulator HflC [Shewanella sp. 7_MG-2023]MDO6771469.1 protease modulator HflC [Shewanella sp. 2_MG-2023]MDO6793695.1 protease modulator HflC [Shewanella sp. 1_MG-2023]
MGRFGLIILVILLGIGFSSLMVVNEGERAIVSRFGEILKDDVNGEAVTRVLAPGIHFKIPAIDKVKYLDARIQTLDGAADRFVTSEKKDLMVDSYVKWRINDFETFYLSTGGGNIVTAEDLLQRKINNDLRTEFGRRTIKEIVSGKRDELQNDALENAAESSQDLGIEVVDVRVKQINLPANVSSSIFQRMRAERQAVAKEHRAQGKEQSEIIRATIDADVTVKVAEAERKALTVRGEGDALSAKIYADAYNKDPEFYGFLRSLEAYKESFAGNSDVMVLEPDSDFFKYMKSIDGK